MFFTRSDKIINETNNRTYRVSSVDQFARLTELDHALLEVGQWTLNQHFLLLVVGKQVVPQRLLQNNDSEIKKRNNQYNTGLETNARPRRDKIPSRRVVRPT